MRLTKTGAVNIVVYGAIVLLVAIFAPQLRWAAGAVLDYWSHRFPPLQESRLRGEAYEILLQGGDLDRAERLLHESLRIEPYTVAVMLLGEVHLARGNHEQARAQYERYLAINPSHLESYLRLAQLHAQAGRSEERRRLLERALAHFRSEAALYAARPDPTAPPDANEKARAVHDGYLRAIERLERELEGLPVSPPAAATRSLPRGS